MSEPAAKRHTDGHNQHKQITRQDNNTYPINKHWTSTPKVTKQASAVRHRLTIRPGWKMGISSHELSRMTTTTTTTVKVQTTFPINKEEDRQRRDCDESVTCPKWLPGDKLWSLPSRRCVLLCSWRLDGIVLTCGRRRRRGDEVAVRRRWSGNNVEMKWRWGVKTWWIDSKEMRLWI